MKKTLKLLTAILTLILAFSVMAIPASAAEITYSNAPFYEEFEESYNQAINEMQNQQNEYNSFKEEIETSRKAQREAERAQKEMQTALEDLFFAALGISVILVCLAFVIAQVLFIFFAAPKCGMTRLWALVPLFSRLLGLLVCIAIITNRKNLSPKHVKVCPHCNCKNPKGTTVCSICGETL